MPGRGARRTLSALTSHLAEFAARARESVHVAAALGAAAELERHLDRDASLVAAEDAGWVPLAYVCASPLHRLSARHAAGLLECARLLLDRGADPNATTPVDDAKSGTPIPVGVRAALSGNAAVAMLLQRRGAIETSSDVRQAVMAQLESTAAVNPLAEVIREYFQRPDVRAAMQEAFDRWRAEHGIGGHRIPPTFASCSRRKFRRGPVSTGCGPSSREDLTHRSRGAVFGAPIGPGRAGRVGRADAHAWRRPKCSRDERTIAPGRSRAQRQRAGRRRPAIRRRR